MKELQVPMSNKKKRQGFLHEFGGEYGYEGRIDKIRDKEYPQLKGSVYLDHTGSTTYAESALANFHHDLANNLYGNPHSDSPSSALATERVDSVRNRVLFHFNANPDHYDVIFTPNATGAIKLVGEAFPWAKGKTSFQYLREGHTSLLGLRNTAEYNGAREVLGLTEDEVKDRLMSPKKRNPHFHNNITQVDLEDNIDGVSINPSGVTYNLFAYPAQCNFSGSRFPLKWIRQTKRTFNTETEKTLVMLDAAAYVTTSPLSLAVPEHSPDFMCISFYKMFGFPTGLGACIMKKELSPILEKRYFGGGTVAGIIWEKNWQIFREELHERYEDGTINFLSIIALDHAFDAHLRIYRNMNAIRDHVASLSIFLYREMVQLRHWNGTPVCRINSDRDFADPSRQGSILSFNLLRADGTWIIYTDAVRLAGAHKFSIRGGSHCNPGCVARWHPLSAQELKDRRCGDNVGSLRVSIGAMTTIDDILAWLDFVSSFYVEYNPLLSMGSHMSAHLNMASTTHLNVPGNPRFSVAGAPKLNKKSSFRDMLRKRPSIPSLFQ